MTNTGPLLDEISEDSFLNAFLKVPEAGINKDNLTKVLM
ncbi:C2H2 type zinc finger domain protein [Aspergillus luchuensis]|uniref:C2H2 type zinc finger domain protein n=1 Tax=Aspergillus kawachii TaxID=1069201 RepID=A0A146F8D5_ASPKA|nr:C2H2 type zinc finger domain protein [Aspergillus luchuensis]